MQGWPSKWRGTRARGTGEMKWTLHSSKEGWGHAREWAEGESGKRSLPGQRCEQAPAAAATPVEVRSCALTTPSSQPAVEGMARQGHMDLNQIKKSRRAEGGGEEY